MMTSLPDPSDRAASRFDPARDDCKILGTPCQEFEAAVGVVAGLRWAVADAVHHVPPRPGLYAIYGDERAWSDLKPATCGWSGNAFHSKDPERPEPVASTPASRRSGKILGTSSREFESAVTVLESR